MKRIASALLLLLSKPAWSTWQGKLDLNASAQPVVVREVHDGQWLAGIAHPNLWHLDHDGNVIFHIGPLQVWNAQSGNGSFGLLCGVDLGGLGHEIGVDIPSAIDALGQDLNVPHLFHPASYFASMLSFDTFLGYRPWHDASVNGNLTYGVGATLKIPFGVTELQSSL